MRDKRNYISKRKQWILSSENDKQTKIFPNTTFNLVANRVHFHVKWRKAHQFDARTVDLFFVFFETGLEKPMLTLNVPNGFNNTTNVYSIHLELRMASPCQISTGKWKYVNPCLDFLGGPDQRTAYAKPQARPRWTCVRRSSVTPDLFTMICVLLWNWVTHMHSGVGHRRVGTACVVTM